MSKTSLPDPIRQTLTGYTSTGENLRTASSSEVYFYHHPNWNTIACYTT